MLGISFWDLAAANFVSQTLCFLEREAGWSGITVEIFSKRFCVFNSYVTTDTIATIDCDEGKSNGWIKEISFDIWRGGGDFGKVEKYKYI